MPVSRIVAVGHHQPTRVLTNADLEAMVDTSDAWIRQRTGIATRRIAGPQESVTDLAAAAGAKAVAAAGLEAGQIDHSLRAGAAEHALVIGAEKMSDVTDWTDRSTCVLLGDGAGAAVLSSGSGSGTPIGPVVWGSDPTRADAVRLVDAWQPRFAQEGQSIFRWATGELPALAEQACHRAGITPATWPAS